MPTTRRRTCRFASRLGWALCCLAAAGLMLAAVAPMGGLAPEPDPVPKRWQVDVQFGDLRMYSVQRPDGTVASYLYLTYAATNRSGEDLLFAPAFELSVGAGETIRAGRDVPGDVTKALLERLENPLLQDQIGIIGPLQQGPENAREGLVVFAFDHYEPEQLVIYAAGFSGETAIVQPPAPVPAAAASATPAGPASAGSASSGAIQGGVVLRKTVVRRYVVPGSMIGLGDRPIELAEQRWIMR